MRVLNFLVAGQGSSVETALLLLQKGANPNIPQKVFNFFFHYPLNYKEIKNIVC